VKGSLDNLASNSSRLLPTTLLFIEIPTNPDMKVPNLAELAKLAAEYKE
jgi:cystathionine beta-lyase/cystathionine gamma-synthase